MPGCTLQARLADDNETVPANGTKFISLKQSDQIAGASSVPGDPMKVVTYTARVKPGVKGIKLCGILPAGAGNFVRSGVRVHLTPRSLTATMHALGSEGTGAVVFAKRVRPGRAAVTSERRVARPPASAGAVAPIAVPTPASMRGCTLQAIQTDANVTGVANGRNLISIKRSVVVTGRQSDIPGDPLVDITFVGQVKPGVHGLRLCGARVYRGPTRVTSHVTVSLAVRRVTVRVRVRGSDGVAIVIFAKRVGPGPATAAADRSEMGAAAPTTVAPTARILPPPPGCTIEAILSPDGIHVPANGTKLISFTRKFTSAGPGRVAGDPLEHVTYTAQVKAGVHGLRLCAIQTYVNHQPMRPTVISHSVRRISARVTIQTSDDVGGIVWAKRVRSAVSSRTARVASLPGARTANQAPAIPGCTIEAIQTDDDLPYPANGSKLITITEGPRVTIGTRGGDRVQSLTITGQVKPGVRGIRICRIDVYKNSVLASEHVTVRLTARRVTARFPVLSSEGAGAIVWAKRVAPS